MEKMSKFLHIILVYLLSLTIISIILPSSPIFSQESGVLYPWKTTSGDVWKSFGDARFQPEYRGEISNSKPHGVGILYNGDPNRDQKNQGYHFSPRSRYIGEWKNGKIHGQGTFTHFDGSIKIGTFRQGQDWETIWYGNLGNTIKTFSKGKIVLKQKYMGILFGRSTGGSIIWSQNNTDFTDREFEGEIENGEPNGMGKVIFKNGDNYEGSWINGNFNGQGIFIYYDGGKYVGEWKEGRYYGTGTLTFSDGLKKVGEFRKGEDWNTIWYNLKGDIAGKYLNGILQK